MDGEFLHEQRGLLRLHDFVLPGGELQFILGGKVAVRRLEVETLATCQQRVEMCPSP